MVNVDNRTLGQRLKIAREQRGYYTAWRLAEDAGVDPNWLYRIESDKTVSPSSLHLLKVATALGVTMEYLLTGRDRS